MFIIKQSKISICPKLKEKLNSKFKKWNQLTFVIFCSQNESIINDNNENIAPTFPIHKRFNVIVPIPEKNNKPKGNNSSI